MGVAALVLGLLCGWMLWIVHNSLDGGRWFDLIVGLVLGELILAVGLFALVLLTWAIFAPTWLSRALTTAHHKLAGAIVATLLILIFVIPILELLGILR